MSVPTQAESPGWRVARYGCTLILSIHGLLHTLDDKPVLGAGMLFLGLFVMVVGIRPQPAIVWNTVRAHEWAALAAGLAGIALILGQAATTLFG